MISLPRLDGVMEEWRRVRSREAVRSEEEVGKRREVITSLWSFVSEIKVAFIFCYLKFNFLMIMGINIL